MWNYFCVQMFCNRLLIELVLSCTLILFWKKGMGSNCWIVYWIRGVVFSKHYPGITGIYMEWDATLHQPERDMTCLNPLLLHCHANDDGLPILLSGTSSHQQPVHFHGPLSKLPQRRSIRELLKATWLVTWIANPSVHNIMANTASADHNNNY